MCILEIEELILVVSHLILNLQDEVCDIAGMIQNFRIVVFLYLHYVLQD